MKKSALYALAVGLLASGLTPASMQAQSCTMSGNATCSVTAGASITVPTIYYLGIGTTASSAGTISIANMNAGYIDVPAGQLPTIRVLTNQSWRLLSSAPNFWTAVGANAWTSKPYSDLLWGSTALTITTPITVISVTIAAGTATQNTIVPMFYRILLSWVNDTEGAYSIPVTYTLVSP